MEIVIWIVIALVLIFGFVVFFGAPYVPAKLKHVRQAFDELYHLKPSDLLLDLGSGDGKVLREAARRGAKAVGMELNPVLVVLSNLIGRRLPKQKTKLANMWTMPFPDDTTVVYVFTDSRDIRRLSKRVRTEASRLGRPIHVISYGFTLPELKLVKKNKLHYLYEAKPLQVKKPQV